MALEYHIRHALPGRIRLYVPAIRWTDGLGEACVSLLRSQAGVRDVRVNRACGAVVICYDPASRDILSRLQLGLGALTPNAILALAGKVKPEARPDSQSQDQPADASGWAWMWKPLALPTISMALSLVGGTAGTLISLPLIGYNAFPILKRAFKVVKDERRLNVDFLDGLAVTISTLQGSLFTTAFMTWLISLGDAIRDHTAAKSKRAIEGLLDYQGRKVWVVKGRKKIEVNASDVRVDDVVVVYTGGMIPVDGLVVKGHAVVDQKTITGESMPVDRKTGDKVYAATVVRDGKLYLKTVKAGSETTAAQIVRLVEEAPVGETRIQNYAEKFADKLVAPTLGVAGAFYAATGDLNRLLSMLIIDFGTGIRVAAPTSVLAYMTHAARQGIVIKGGSSIEKLSQVDTIAFDKTGTLTHGVPRVLDVASYNGRRFPSDKVLALAAAAEARLKHPLALAVQKRARLAGVKVPERSESHYHLGLGVEVRVNGYLVEVGSERFLRGRNVRLDAARGDLKQLNGEGRSALLLAVNGELAGLLPYADVIRPESRAVVRALRKRGIKHVLMLTGDNSTVAKAVADRLGMDGFFPQVLPAEKAEIIQQLQREGRRVAMVGDGINDSVALSYADVGIAMKNGADVARETADVVLMEENLWKVAGAIDISKDAIKLIRQNYAIIAGLNTLAFAMTIPAGMASPGLTTLISNGSAILASLNAIRPVLGY